MQLIEGMGHSGAREMIHCKHCDALLDGDVRPGALVRCGMCEKKNRLPQPREFAETFFHNSVRDLGDVQIDPAELASAVASARLNGARWNRIAQSLDATSISFPVREEVLEAASGIIKARSHEDGRGMFTVGIICTVMCAVATVVQQALGWQTIYISASLIAIGGVYTLVGALKWLTGWNVR